MEQGQKGSSSDGISRSSKWFLVSYSVLSSSIMALDMPSITAIKTMEVLRLNVLNRRFNIAYSFMPNILPVGQNLFQPRAT